MAAPWEGATQHLSKADPRLAPLIKQVGPPKWGLERDRFRALAESIVYQQLAGSAAAAIVRKTTAHFGRFPRPEDIVATRSGSLRACGLSPQKERYLRELSQAVVKGDLDFRRLARAPDEEVIEALTEIHGIGRWTAEMFLLFSLGRPDVWPVGDYGVQKGVQKFLGQKTLPAKSRMHKVAEPWKPYRSTAAWYMWRSLDLTTQGTGRA